MKNWQFFLALSAAFFLSVNSQPERVARICVFLFVLFLLWAIIAALMDWTDRRWPPADADDTQPPTD